MKKTNKVKAAAESPNAPASPPEIRINIRVPKEEKAQLKAISERLSVSSTYIVREAVKEKINELNAKLKASKPGEVVTI